MYRNNLNSTQILNQSMAGIASSTANLNHTTHFNANCTSENENIQVMIRIRNIPLTESQRFQTNPLVVENNQIRIQYSNELKSQTYSFDKVAAQDKDQDYIYQEIGIPVVNSCIQGINTCIFAYGQTGAGKTYTMTGSSTNVGLQQKVLDNLFQSLIQKVSSQELTSFKVNVSYYEIYNEQINDLVNNRKDIKIRENLDGPFIENLTSITVNNFNEAQNLFNTSTKNRSIAATMMNKQSSRSHSIFTVNILMIDNNLTETTSKLNFVDMAGSERQKKTQTEGQRLKEAGSINKSLFEFSKVIGDLAKQRNNVVFRNSKLTHILKDCLVGNSKTFIICAVNPSFFHIDETENTLKFASNAKFIQTKPFANQVAKVNVEELQKQIKDHENSIEQQVKLLSEKDSIIEQLKLHSESQDEEIIQIRNYYCKEIQEIEAEKIQQLNYQQSQILDLQKSNVSLSQHNFEIQIKLSEQKCVVDNQEIQIKELKERIRRMLEEKKSSHYESEKQKLSSKIIDLEEVSEHSTDDEKTPTPGVDGYTEFNDSFVQLEVEVNILRNQNIYNKSVQRELEQINSQLSNQNREMHMTSSNLLREKESLLQEMNKINETLGQRSQMLTSEIENYKEQMRSQMHKLECTLSDNRQQQKYINKLRDENNKLIEKLQMYEQQFFENSGNNLQDDDKSKKLSLYLKQIHNLTSELKKKSEVEKVVEEEKQKLLQDKQMIIQKQQKIQEISQSIISEISSSSSIEEISQNQFNMNLKDMLEKKCEELNHINEEVVQELHDMKQENDSLRNIIQGNKEMISNTKQFFSERNKKTKRNRHIQQQLEIFFIENPDFYINKKKLECFENFIHFVFSSIRQLLSPNNSQTSLSNLNQNKEHSNILRVKEFIDAANSDMLMYHFKDLVENEKRIVQRRYNTLKDFLIMLVHNQKPEQIICPSDEQRYREYIDSYADSNQVQQIRSLIFDEYNLINLRKSKRSPCKVTSQRVALGEKSMNVLNMVDSNQMRNIFDEQKTIYDAFMQGKKKIKTNEYQ